MIATLRIPLEATDGASLRRRRRVATKRAEDPPRQGNSVRKLRLNLAPSGQITAAVTTLTSNDETEMRSEPGSCDAATSLWLPLRFLSRQKLPPRLPLGFFWRLAIA
jgi:hypothetical protein